MPVKVGQAKGWVCRALRRKPSGNQAGGHPRTASGQGARGSKALACPLGQFQHTINDQLRTGADKGNLTV